MITGRSTATFLSHPLQLLLRYWFWMGVFLMVYGNFVTFLPGVEPKWYTLTGAFLLAGVFIPCWRYRIATILFLTLGLGFSIRGYNRGLEYRKSLELRSLQTASQGCRRTPGLINLNPIPFDRA